MKFKPLFKSETEQPIKLCGLPNILESDIPLCKECGSKMSFIYNISTNKASLLVFQCTSNPGMCDDWDANSGANKVLYWDKTVTIDKAKGFIEIQNSEFDDDKYEDMSINNKNCIGKFGGSPLWLQNDETPICNCGKSMTFVSQIEERGHREFNFGMGCSYLFSCDECKVSKFLWQC